MNHNASELFREQVGQNLDKPALCYDLDGEACQVSFRELYDRIGRTARVFRDAGLQPGDSVLISMESCSEFVEAAFGAMRAGLSAVLIDHNIGEARLTRLLGTVPWQGAVVGPGTNVGLLDTLARADSRLRLMVGQGSTGATEWEDFATVRDSEPTELDAVPVMPSDAALVFFTSGTTGEPKAIVKSHAHFQLVAPYARAATRHSAHLAGHGELGDGVYLVPSPLFHSAGFQAGVTMGMLRGWTGVLLARFAPGRFLARLASHKCTTVLCMPSQAASCLREHDLLAALDLRALQSFRITGGPVSRTTLEGLRNALPGTQVINAFGLTECPLCFGAPPGHDDQPLFSVGQPLPGVETKLIDSEGRESDVGELWIKSELISKGTLWAPTERVSRFVGDWFRSRDIFARDQDGWHYFCGRDDDMFVCGGKNVVPSEIERVLGEHAAVSEVAVVGVDDPILGKVPGAAVVLKPGANASSAELLAYYRVRGDAHTVPRTVVFVAALPSLGPGKIDRSGVRAAIVAAASRRTAAVAVPSGEDAEPGSRQPGAIESALERIWASVLGVERIDRAAHFFDQGGDSLGAVVVLAEMAAAGFDIDTEELFDLGSIDRLASVLRERLPSTPSATT